MPDGMVVVGVKDAKTIIEMAEHPLKPEKAK
jgi:hypothetical protein